MSIDLKQLKEEIVVPTLKTADMYSESAVNLLLGTSAQESHLGTYIKQLGSGPALGIYQMEPATHDDIVNNYLAYKHKLRELITESFDYEYLDYRRLKYDLQYATLFTRLHYLRVKEVLPEATDLSGLARYWKKYYNTPLGAGTEEEFIHNYSKYVRNI